MVFIGMEDYDLLPEEDPNETGICVVPEEADAMSIV